MKISKNFVQISTTAIITSLVMLTCNLFTNSKGGFVIKSQPITWEEAVKMKNEYKTSPRSLKVKSGKNVVTLEGLVFQANQIRDILDNPLGKPDSIIIYFGKQGEFDDLKFGIPIYKKFDSLHIIAAGIKDNKVLTNIVIDKADPCPPNCP